LFNVELERGLHGFFFFLEFTLDLDFDVGVVNVFMRLLENTFHHRSVISTVHFTTEVV
jgi:hypothetical protein